MLSFFLYFGTGGIIIHSQLKEFLYFTECEAEFLGPLNKLDLINMTLGKNAIPRAPAIRFWYEFPFFVVANGILVHSRQFSGFTYFVCIGILSEHEIHPAGFSIA